MVSRVRRWKRTPASSETLLHAVGIRLEHGGGRAELGDHMPHRLAIPDGLETFGQAWQSRVEVDVNLAAEGAALSHQRAAMPNEQL